MKPVDVSTALDTTDPNVLMWTRPTKGGPVSVGFVPSLDPVVRAAQEADLTRHLDQRAPLPGKGLV